MPLLEDKSKWSGLVLSRPSLDWNFFVLLRSLSIPRDNVWIIFLLIKKNYFESVKSMKKSWRSYKIKNENINRDLFIHSIINSFISTYNVNYNFFSPWTSTKFCFFFGWCLEFYFWFFNFINWVVFLCCCRCCWVRCLGWEEMCSKWEEKLILIFASVRFVLFLQDHFFHHADDDRLPICRKHCQPLNHQHSNSAAAKKLWNI